LKAASCHAVTSYTNNFRALASPQRKDVNSINNITTSCANCARALPHPRTSGQETNLNTLPAVPYQQGLSCSDLGHTLSGSTPKTNGCCCSSPACWQDVCPCCIPTHVAHSCSFDCIITRQPLQPVRCALVAHLPPDRDTVTAAAASNPAAAITHRKLMLHPRR
jgi:hypothetical protein